MPAFLLALLVRLKGVAIADAILELAKREINAVLVEHNDEAQVLIAKLNKDDVNTFIMNRLYPALKDEYVIKKFGHTFVIPGKKVLTPTVLAFVLVYLAKGENAALIAARSAIKAAYAAAEMATA